MAVFGNKSFSNNYQANNVSDIVQRPLYLTRRGESKHMLADLEKSGQYLAQANVTR